MKVKQIVQYGLVSCGVTLLVGCATPQNYAAAVNSWQGAPESALKREWGHPTHVHVLGNGNELLTYRVVEHEPVSKTYSPAPGFVRLSPQNNNTVVMSHPSVRMGHHEATFWCETSFEVNKRGVIVDTRYKGNNCVTTQSGTHRWSFTQ